MDNPKTMRPEQLLLLWKESDLPLIPHVHFRLDMQKHLMLIYLASTVSCNNKLKTYFLAFIHNVFWDC